MKINSDYYLKVLQILRMHIALKQTDIQDTWILHQDNARPHTARKVIEYL